MPQVLDLADAPEVLAYNVIVDQILNAGLPIRRLVTWEGDVADDDRLTTAEGVDMRLWPLSDPAAARWTYPGQKKVRLTVEVEMLLPSGNIRDLLNLWHAVRMAFYPRDEAGFTDLQSRLRAAGVEDGIVWFPQSVAAGNPEDARVGKWLGVGTLAVDVSISVSHQ